MEHVITVPVHFQVDEGNVCFHFEQAKASIKIQLKFFWYCYSDMKIVKLFTWTVEWVLLESSLSEFSFNLLWSISFSETTSSVLDFKPASEF